MEAPNILVPSCSASSITSSCTSMTTTASSSTEVATANKPPRSPPLPSMTKSLPPRARAQSTDSGSNNSLQKTITTGGAAGNNSNSNSLPPPPPPSPSMRNRCSSYNNNSPPPLPPGRARAYSSDSDQTGRSVATSVSTTSSSCRSSQRKRLDRREGLRKSVSCSSTLKSAPPVAHGSGSSMSSNSVSSNNGSGGGGGPLDVQTLEIELQKTILIHGKHDVSVGKLWNAIGNTHFRNGNQRESIQAYKQACSCDPGPHLGTAYLNLGTVYWNLLKVDKSINYLQQALAVFEYELTAAGKAPGAASLDIANCHYQLGLAYSLQHHYDEAVSSMETACRLRATLLGPNHPTTAKTLDALGRVHLSRGDCNQALICHEQALYALRQANLPAVATLENIAAVHMRRRDFSAAIYVLVQVVYMYKSAWQAASAKQQQTNSALAEQYYESLQQLAMAYDYVGETKYADHCRQEAAEVLEHSD